MSLGFTIIELLVVVAIIAVLASIVLINVNAIRAKAADAKTEAQMAALRPAAATYYDSNANNYGPATAAAANCTTGGMGLDTASGFANLVLAASYSNAVAPTCSTDSTVANVATRWSAWHTLQATAGTAFCVDSTGQGKVEPSGWTPPTTGASCP